MNGYKYHIDKLEVPSEAEDATKLLSSKTSGEVEREGKATSSDTVLYWTYQRLPSIRQFQEQGPQSQCPAQKRLNGSAKFF